MSIHQNILQQLEQVEKKYHVKIIYACESGSRAWGFASEDSDYDVRFIYAHPKDWYLSITQKRDVIELPIDDVLDINGWDIRKTLALLRKSNGPLLEWLSSPIVYLTDETAMQVIQPLADKAFLPKTLCYHYLAMAKKIMYEIDASESVTIKKYLYALRPTLCAKWIIENKTRPPVLFQVLKQVYLTAGELQNDIERILKLKTVSREKDTVNRVESIDCFIHNEIEHIENNIPENPKKTDIDYFNQVFIHIIT